MRMPDHPNPTRWNTSQKTTPPICLLVLIGVTSLSGTVVPFPDKVACTVPDRQAFQQPDQVHVASWLGTRIAANEVNRLAKIDPARLLEGYRQRPGRQSWDGEHVGKWLHAATLAWVYSGDAALRQKLDMEERSARRSPRPTRRHL
jgi:hypothetical protein